MKKFTILVLIFIANLAYSQSTEILPGLVLPQMTTDQRIAMVNPVEGSLVFDTNTKTYWFRKIDNWVELVGSVESNSYWQLSGTIGNELKNTNTGGFWSKNPTPVELYASDITNPPTSPAPEEDQVGTRLMWIPSRSAFRVGTSALNYWAPENIGLFSFAAGADVQAKGKFSTAFGYFNRANGQYSVAMGYNCDAENTSSIALGNAAKASGINAIALGSSATASGSFSVSIGTSSEASGINAIAFGTVAKATGTKSTAIGHSNTASGELSTTLGTQNKASGSYSTAMGFKMNTNNKKGAFMIGDSDPDNEGETLAGAADQFIARFKNGYYLLTSGDDAPRTGVFINNGQTAWSAISDSTRKERFVSADGEDFLSKLRNLRLGSWNYKNQKTSMPERFYGPMAQELFAAFGKDKYGTIGTNTTVSTINMDGLLFVFSQALEKRTTDLQIENNQLKSQAIDLKEEAKTLKVLIQQLDVRLTSLESDSKQSEQSPKLKVRQTEKHLAVKQSDNSIK
jgi:hypothetical protein